MSKQKIIILLLSLAIVLPIVGYAVSKKAENDSKVQSKPKANDLQYELIMDAFFFKNNILKPNAALLITNKEEIKADAKMFLSKRRMYYLCGYHYRFLFWTNDGLFGHISVNESCEAFGYKPKEAREKLACYVKQLETAPTHYIYNLEIPVSMAPNEVREKLKDTELHLFFIDGEQTRFSDVRFSYWCYQYPSDNWEKTKKENEEIAKKKIQELVNEIKTISSVVYESDINYSYTRYNDSTYRRGRINLTFEVGTNISKIVTLLEQEGAKIERQNNPSTYFVQAVDTSDNINYIKDKLKQYEFIKGITEYKKRYRDENTD